MCEEEKHKIHFLDVLALLHKLSLAGTFLAGCYFLSELQVQEAFVCAVILALLLGLLGLWINPKDFSGFDDGMDC